MRRNRHRCGGALHPQIVELSVEREGLEFQFWLPGLVCDRCGEEVIERDAALSVQSALRMGAQGALSAYPHTVLYSHGKLLTSQAAGPIGSASSAPKGFSLSATSAGAGS